MIKRSPVDFDGAVLKILVSKDERQSRGTGFFISEEFRELHENVNDWFAYFITCYHVIGDNQGVWVTWHGVKEPVFAEKVIDLSDEKMDFAIFKVHLVAANKVLMIDGSWAQNERIFTKGFQYGKFDGYPASGLITGDTIKNENRLLVMEEATHIQPGISGAPAWSERAQAIIGIISEKWEKTNTAFVIPLFNIAMALSQKTKADRLNRIVKLANKHVDKRLDDLKEQASQPRYYLYVSDKKLEMLWPQINSETRENIANQLGLASIDKEKDITQIREVKLRIIEKYIDESNNVGSVEDPKSYVRGSIDASIGFLKNRENLSGFGGGSYVYFGGNESKKDVALLGSPQHVIGQVGNWNDIHSRGAYAYLLPLVIDVLKKDAPVQDERDLSYYISWINGDIGSNNGKEETRYKQRISYLAKVLIRSEHSILATPIYVAISDDTI